MYVDQPGMSYEARYGWNRQSWRLIWIGLIFCAVALLPAVPLWLKIVDIAFFGGGTVMLLAASLRHALAVRVDQAGVTLCASPMFPKSTTRLFPWEDITTVIIWRGPFSGRVNRLEFVGVERRSGALPLSGKFIGRRAQSAARLEAPGIPPEAAVTRAATNGWVLDHAKLTAAVAHFGPGVRMVDLVAGPLPAQD